jgi:toxin YoeB
MEEYTITLTKSAEKDLSLLKKSGKKLDIKKIEGFFLEVAEKPRFGTGKPEQLKHTDGEFWSREINKKDRFVYQIFEQEKLIVIIQVLGHYSDK